MTEREKILWDMLDRISNGDGNAYEVCGCPSMALEALKAASKIKLSKKDKKKRTLLEAIKLARGGDAPIQKQCI